MAAAAAMGRAGHLRAAAAARWLRSRGFSTNKNNGGGPATPGGNMTGGAGGEIGKATGGGAASNGGGAATGGGAANNGGGGTNGKATIGGGAATVGGTADNNGGATCRDRGCEGVTQLRTDTFAKTRQFWDRYNVGAEKDRELFGKVAELRKETATKYVSSKVQLVSTTYLMVASTGLAMLVLATGVSPYLKERIVRDAADKVEEILGREAGAGGAPGDGKN